MNHEKRSNFLLLRLNQWLAQLKWEKEHGPLVKWDAAVENVIRTLDDADDKEMRERLIKRTDLLQLAHRVLSLERRKERLKVKKMIEEFMSAGATRCQ